MSIHRKKSAVINSQVRVNNQISQVFIPNSAASVASININNIPIIPVNNTNIISTKYATISDIRVAYDIGQNWQSAISGVLNNTWLEVCWAAELGLFCAVSSSGTANERVMISNDGLTWRNATSGVHDTTGWEAVCWSRELGLFCAVGTTTTTDVSGIMISSDGITWTNATSYSGDPGKPWRGVCWAAELGRFCAVSSHGTVMVSTNGIVWIQSASTSNIFTGICWSPEVGIFCATGNNYTQGYTSFMISRDGYNWTGVGGANPVTGNYRTVCWSSELGLFCTCANRVVGISRDGFNWTYTTTGVIADRTWNSVCWAPEIGLFCAVADNSNGSQVDRVIVSSDGLNWRYALSGVINSGLGSVCWSPELSVFCVVGYSGPANQRAMITNQSYIANLNDYNNYIPLVSSNGTPEIKTNTSISYNINKNTLNLVNLSTANLPTCSAVPVNSNDLINKAYLNSFVGDYTQGWIYDDWITGDASGSLNWNIDNPANASIIASDASGHIGILTLNGPITLTLSIGNVFNYSNIKSVKFIVKPFSNVYAGNGFVFIGLSIDYNAITGHSVGFYKEQGSGWFYVMNNAKITTNVYYILPLETQKKWILFEIEITNNIPTFYITIQGETGRILTCAPGYPITSTPSVKPVIRNTNGMIDVDYIDLKYSGITRA